MQESDNNMRMLCALTLLGHVACWSVGQTAEPTQSKKSIVAVVAKSPQNDVPLAEFSLGSATVSESIDLDLELRNDSDTNLQFDDVQTGCNCTKIAPRSGTIVAKGKLLLKLRVTTAELPTGAVGGGIINFMLKNRPSFDVRFTYGLSRYAGIPSRLIVLTMPSDAHELEFSVPLVTGEGVTEEDIAVEAIFEDATSAVQGRIDIAARTLTGIITFDPEKEISKLFGSLVIRDTKTGVSRQTPVIVEREANIAVYPRILRFTQEATGGEYVAVFYVRHRSEGSGDAKCQVGVSVGGDVVTGQTSIVNNHITRVQVKLPEPKASALKDTSESSRPPSRPAKIDIRVNEQTLTLNAPLRFKEKK